MEILQKIESDLLSEMAKQAHSDKKDMSLLNAIKSVKSDFLYLKEKNTKSDLDIVITLHKNRSSAILSYLDQESELSKKLYNEFLLEIDYLNEFIPTPIDEEELFEFFDTTNIQKSKMNFKTFQQSALERFGQKVDSQLIFKYITT